MHKTSQKAEVKHLKEDTSEKCNRYQSEIEFQKKKLESKQTSASSPEDPEAPELPNREYLTDIDFIAQEFDLLLTRAPELPNRAEDSTNTWTSSDATADNKTTERVKNTAKQQHGTQQFLLPHEPLGMTPRSAIPGPQKHNLMKESNSKVLTGRYSPQSREQKIAGEIKARNQGSHGFKHSASSACQQSLQKQTGTRPLPYRQPMKVEQLQQLVSGSQDLDTCPTYQNITEEECTYDNVVTVDYQNVTGDVQQTEMNYQNILSKQKQQISKDTATYQPLIFHCAGTEEDEYMEMDMM